MSHNCGVWLLLFKLELMISCSVLSIKKRQERGVLYKGSESEISLITDLLLNTELFFRPGFHCEL